jgi:shikimate dehydrogenase
MHNAAFAELGLNWRYLPLPVPPDQVEAALRGLAALGFRGANVTVPHKETAQKALRRVFGPEAVAAEAEALGAVNTLVIERHNEREVAFGGHNTDVAGFVDTLEAGGFQPEGTSALVVGAGGAARAVVYGLIRAGARTIMVLNRTARRAEILVSDLAPSSGHPLRARPFTDEALIQTARTADLLVNATPVGMWPRTDRSIWPEQTPIPSHLTVLDLVYNPLETTLHRQARASGAAAIDGLGMLVRQGALALKMWTGEDPPIEAMRAACERSLQR